MSEFQRWSSQHRTIRASRDWNALLDHGLEKPASYIIRKNGSYIEAINGSTGKIDYGGQNNAGGVSGSDATTVVQSAIDALTSGVVFIKDGIYDVTDIYLKLNVSLIGESMHKTILRAKSGTSRMLRDYEREASELTIKNLTPVSYTHLTLPTN